MKILVSPGFGAGWSTWAHSNQKQVAEYEPIIEYIENGGDPSELRDDHELVIQMKKDLAMSYFFTGGAADLIVKELKDNTAYRINEYDGSESVQTSADFW